MGYLVTVVQGNQEEGEDIFLRERQQSALTCKCSHSNLHFKIENVSQSDKETR